MTAWQIWVQRPQTLWVRKALFQIHLWIGVGIGLYVVAISISGSALVYLPEITNKFSRRTAVVITSGPRLSLEEIAEHAQRAYPGYEVDNAREGQAPEQPDDIVLERAHKRIERLFDPYTGADLGDRYTVLEHVFAWLTDLHNDLLGGKTGRLVNGMASCLLTLLSLTGAILWWPGLKQWRRSTKVKWDAHFPRLTWDLHSAIGFWFWLLLFVWGISGIYFCLPAVLGPPIHPLDRFGDSSPFFTLITRLHMGDFDRWTKVVWSFLGLVPSVSAVTGALMWWNRVLRKRFRRSRQHATDTLVSLPIVGE